MKCKFISDSHCHTDCSFDAADSATMMAENALKQRFYSLTITDHCECNMYYKDEYDKSARQSWFEARKASAAFNGKIHVYAGIELGEPMQGTNEAEDILNACEHDFVLGSIHNAEGYPDFYDFDYEHKDVIPALSLYFAEMAEMIKWGNFDSLAHLTYPWRYLIEHNIKIDYKDYYSQIDDIFRLLIDSKKSLEINTSGLRQRIGETMPNCDLLKRYYDMGGKMITLGSDAHRWGDVGSGIESALNMIKKIGFTHFCIYEKRKPVYLPIS